MKAKSWSGDLTGGVVASIMSLPDAMAYGVLIFSALDPSLAADGLLAGLIAVAAANLGSSLIKGNPIISSSPTALVTLMVASQIPVLITEFPLQPQLLLSLVFLSIFLAGLFQILLGRLHLGQLAKYIPQPVVAGLFNGTALLILKGQIQPLLGLSNPTQSWSALKPLNLAIGLLTWLSAEVAARRWKKIPPAVLALTIGVTAYHLLRGLGYSSQLGMMVGHIPARIPQPTALLSIKQLWAQPQFWHYLPRIITFAAGLAVVASTSTLVACIAGDEVQGQRTDANRELIGQGIGNILAAAFGGIMSSGSPSRTVADYQYGARSRFSRLMMGLLALGAIVFLAPVVGLLPKVVLAGLLVSLAISLLQKESWQQLVDLATSDGMRRQRAAINLTISLMVVVVLIGLGILQAIAVGLLISLIHFVARMSKKVVAEHHQANTKHSFAIRNRAEFEALIQNGDRIHLLNLEGSLFFGTADQVAVYLEQLCHQGANWIILDLSAVVELDSTGSKIMAQSIGRCRQRGIEIALSVRPNSMISELLSAIGLLEVIRQERVFANQNQALVWAEDQLLAQILTKEQDAVDLPLEQVDALADMKEAEIEKLKKYLLRDRVSAGSQLIAQGAQEDSLFVIVQGRVWVELASSPQETSQTVSIICSGRLLGELAFVDHRARSASAYAEGEVAYWRIDYPDFEKLQEESPLIAHKLMQGIANEISMKLRISDRLIDYHLDQIRW